jgi:hypothetical protein
MTLGVLVLVTLAGIAGPPIFETPQEATASQVSPPVAASRAPKLIGLVEVPALIGGPERPATPSPVRLRTEPSSAAPVGCTARETADLETREHGYEELSAVVYEVRDGWYGVRCGLLERLVWLAPADAGTFRSFAELVQHGLAYLTGEWDRRLYQKPHLGAVSQVVRVEAQQPDITVADTAMANGELWLLVVVFGEGRCTVDEPAAVLGAGWTPAHAASGNVAAWFYSRGC